MKYLFTLLALLVIMPSNADSVVNRFSVPAGYTRQKNKPGSFGSWLQQVPLKPRGTPARTYNGDIAKTNAYTAAVADMGIGSYNLQQCADAIIRLRAEYLYQKKDYNNISFNFVSGFKCDYAHYANGYRYQNGKWALTVKKDYTYPAFLRYMNLVFSYASTLSLEKELKPVLDAGDIKAGDVFIRGGSPGHCFIVMDVAEDRDHQKRFLLAQSFMPAQNIQVLQADDSPWFSMSRQANIFYADLIRPQFLRRFAE
nr:DUF4846 domain-containing protein [uncultured Mucilaginibacter sp.]